MNPHPHPHKDFVLDLHPHFFDADPQHCQQLGLTTPPPTGVRGLLLHQQLGPVSPPPIGVMRVSELVGWVRNVVLMNVIWIWKTLGGRDFG
jgi:hypothetical protein